MPKTIRFGLNTADIDRAIRELRCYRASLPEKGREICRRLAEYGLLLAENAYEGTAYDGEKNVFVEVEETERGYRILADGEAVLFLEFGAGITYGYGHPQDADFGMGPGTYPIPPGKGHWNDPKGWWTPEGVHTYGNAPSMAMYNAAKDMRDEVERVAREVFGE